VIASALNKNFESKRFTAGELGNQLPETPGISVSFKSLET